MRSERKINSSRTARLFEANELIDPIDVDIFRPERMIDCSIAELF
jgi:hypothetical protein